MSSFIDVSFDESVGRSPTAACILSASAVVILNFSEAFGVSSVDSLFVKKLEKSNGGLDFSLVDCACGEAGEVGTGTGTGLILLIAFGASCRSSDPESLQFL